MLLVVAAAFVCAAFVNRGNAVTATVAFFVVSQGVLWIFYSFGPSFSWLLFGRRPPERDAASDATHQETLRVAAELCHFERFDEALTVLDHAAGSRPGDVSVALAQAWCLRRRGRLAEAIKVLERAATYEPDEPLVAFALACTWSQAGRLPLALDALSLAVDLDPELRDVIADEPDLAAIRGEDDFARLLTGRRTDSE
jgi:tetratricopeptide (TPR) repeat protein